MNPMVFKDFMGSVDKQTLKKITENMPNTLQSFKPGTNLMPASNYLNPFDFTGIN
jgi:hypothetical protein